MVDVEQVEMGSERVLCGMELAGLGVNQEEYENTRLVLEARCRILQETATRSGS